MSAPLPAPSALTTDKPVVYFYYDIASPFSYLALELLNRYCGKEWPDVQLELRPCSLFHIRLWSDNWPGPPSNEFKMKVIMRDIARMRKLYGIPIVPDNKQFPANCVACNELLAYFKLHNPELLSPASLALFEAYWRDELVPSDPEVIAKYVGPLHPGGAEAVLAIYNDKSKLQAPGVQEMLQAHSKEASETAAFGTPYFIVVKPAPGGKPEVEGFFGSDRMDHIAQFLELPWNGYIPSSASRAPGTETNYPIGDATAMYRQVKPLIDAVQAAAREQGGSGEAAFRQGANN